MANRFERMREASQERILHAALALFGERGYEATSVRMIAAEAGVSQGLLYNYFDGKEGLLQTIFQRNRRDVRASFDRAARRGGPAERLDRLVRSAFSIVGEQLSFWRLSYRLRMQPEVLEGLEGDVRAWSETIRLELEAILHELGVCSPGVEALVLFAAIDGAVQHFVMDPEHYPVDEVSSALVDRFRSAGSSVDDAFNRREDDESIRTKQ